MPISDFHGRLTHSHVLPTLLLLAGCTAAAHGPAHQEPRDAPIPDRDAAGLATWIEESCADAPMPAECREIAVARVAQERGIAVAMDVVARLDVTDAEGHALTHLVGIRGYEGVETAPEAFAACTTLYQSGCYHGVVQAYFAELQRDHEAHQLTEQLVAALCTPLRTAPDQRWSLFQCLHGVGHGVMLANEGHLPRALEACDLIEDGWEREACYGGAFMENLVTVIAPHHDHLQGHGRPGQEHHEHDHHGPEYHHQPGPVADDFEPIDPDDLHYPCSVLDERYQMACYEMQTAAMLHLLDYDIAATAAACRDAPSDTLRYVCHRSLGRDINALTNRDDGRSAELCALADPADRPACHTGVVKNVIDITADLESGVPYCQILPAGRERSACYTAIGEQTAILLPGPAERASFCRSFSGDDREACLAGAGVQAGG